jgi:hypothetical protein
MLDKSAQAGQHTYKERGDDCYETPACAVEALLRVEKLPKKWIWEPACGPGAIIKVLEAHGHKVIGSDLVDYGGCKIMDFLKLEDGDVGVECIVTNPPYQLAEKFVRQALLFSPLVIMLLRLAFLESVRRTDILEKSGLARIHVFRNRLPMMHRRGWDGPKASSAMPFAWFVWERGYKGSTTIDRISWGE